MGKTKKKQASDTTCSAVTAKAKTSLATIFSTVAWIWMGTLVTRHAESRIHLRGKIRPRIILRRKTLAVLFGDRRRRGRWGRYVDRGRCRRIGPRHVRIIRMGVANALPMISSGEEIGEKKRGRLVSTHTFRQDNINDNNAQHWNMIPARKRRKK